MRLNPGQQQAVEFVTGPCLVLAGAGSGKTRVITNKIAHLIRDCGYQARHIAAVTFTNKAAREMKERVGQTLGRKEARGLMISTFHTLGLDIIKREYAALGMKSNFSLFDDTDQVALLKELTEGLIEDDKVLLQQLISTISNWKNDLMTPAQAAASAKGERDRIFAHCYGLYDAHMKACNVLDFDDLILLPTLLLQRNEEVRERWQNKIRYLLVDEYQDTNTSQYELVKLLVGLRARFTVVGDDDQSIYSWRGARPQNLVLLSKDFPALQVIKLEQNYRSTSNILSAANALIENNNGRLGKKLWTDGVDGEPISIYCAFNELDEARFVVNRIKTWQENGGALEQCAILYRSNAQSRVLEEALLQVSMPYRIYGGMRFFERQEIKDALSYLRLIANRNDDAAFERVVNTPTRGIGDRTLDVVRQASRDRQLTLWQACRELLQEKALAGRAASALQRFLELIDALAQETADMPLHVQTDRVIKDSGLRTMYEQEKGEKGQTRIENLEELVTATRQFSYNEEDEDLMPLQAFLSHAALEAGEGQADTWQDAVQLMTLHSAKGLEFPQVFIVGMEEGMFPSQMSLDEGGRLEEERRLAYVGVTRAMQKLTLTYAETRRLYGKEVYHRPSRFIGELPEECVEEVRLRASISRPVSHQRMGSPISETDTGYKLGQRVRHSKFGEGTIVNLEGSGEHSRLQVAFQGQGIKWLVAAYAKLESV